MKLRKVLALSLAAILTFSLAGCGAKEGAAAPETKAETAAATTEATETTEAAAPAADDGTLAYANIVVGETYTDVTANIKWLTHRTDLIESGAIDSYIASFNKEYPNITVEVEGVTDYAQDSLLRLSAGDWGDIMMIPQVDKNLLGEYFVSYGDLSTMSTLINFANAWQFDNQVYGVPSTANAQGIVYNKAVFEAAGVTALPKTPDEFIAALQAIKDKTDAIPLYTNYAAGWTMGAWDAYIGGSATGDANYENQVMIHDAAPFADNGKNSYPCAVYKVLYDAAANGLIEDDYTTTDWEGCKGMINGGEIGTMVLGSWAFSQMVEAGPKGDDIGYMSFPITVDGKQYASAGADYSYGINVNASEDNQKAAMAFVKWMTVKSGFAFNEGGIPIDVNGEYPGLYEAFAGVEFVESAPALAGEETYKDDLNAESELNINAGGNTKIQAIIEHADKGDKDFAAIMEEWNAAWADAQASLGIEAK